MRCLLSNTEIEKVMNEATKIVLSYDSAIIDEVKVNFSWTEEVPTTLFIYTFKKDSEGYFIGYIYKYNKELNEFSFDDYSLI